MTAASTTCFGPRWSAKHCHRIRPVGAAAAKGAGYAASDCRRLPVAGLLCTGLDVLSQSAPLGRDVQPGDLLAVLDLGAYG